MAVAEGDASTAGTEELYKQAYLEGFEAGEEDGRNEARRQASQALAQLEEARAEADAARQRWREGLQEAMAQFEQATARQNIAVAKLAADLAEIAVRKIVGRLHAEHRAVEAACVETLRALHIDATQVRINPVDREGFVETIPGIELMADASLEPGACLLRSPLGDIDAGLATQLAQLRQALTAALAEDRT
jgi:flagellar assembly protein FliH